MSDPRHNFLTSESVIARNPAYAYRVVHNRTYLTDGIRSHCLNSTATFIWERLARPQTMGAVAASLALRYKLPLEQAQVDVYTLVVDLFRAGLVAVDGRISSASMVSLTPEQRLALAGQLVELVADTKRKQILIKLTIELTYACNLRCLYCYAPKSFNGMLTLTEVAGLLEQAAEMGTLFLTLTGGEPLARHDLVEIVTQAETLGFWTRIQTGGALFSKHLVDRLAKFRHLSVSVTLHGADAATHDRFTQVPGSFQRAIEGIRLLAQAGVPVTIKQVITQHNVHQTQALTTLAAELGVRIQRSPLIYPTTMGDTEPLKLRIGNETGLWTNWLGIRHKG